MRVIVGDLSRYLEEVRLSSLLAAPKVGLRREEGYTLVETIVAMAVFVSVVIPIGAVIGFAMIGHLCWTGTGSESYHLMLELVDLNLSV